MAQNFGSRIMAALINSPLHGLMENSMAVIIVSGRKSGAPISTLIHKTRNDEGWTTDDLAQASLERVTIQLTRV